MEQYIPKYTLVDEIEKRIKTNTLLQQKPEMSDLQEELQNKIDCLNSIKGYIINTIEVKEVDLEKELDSMITPELKFHKALPSLFDVAKHFFELGLKAQKV